MIKYGLTIKGKNKPLEFDMSVEEGEFSNSVSVTLEESGTGVWLVDTLKEAEHARDTKPEWFNVSYATPDRYSKWELEVIPVQLNYRGVYSGN